MGRASNRKWKARMAWDRNRFVKLKRLLPWLFVYNIKHAAANLAKSIDKEIYKETRDEMQPMR